MGIITSKLFGPTDLKVLVKTGDLGKSGTDANVKIILHDESGKTSSEYKLDKLFRDDFERGSLDAFNLSLNGSDLGPVRSVEFWCDGSGLFAGWYVEYIKVILTKNPQEVFEFPVFRWIKPDYHYVIDLYDTCLPQKDRHITRRREELEDKKKVYETAIKAPGMPTQVRLMPEDEKFSWDYKWNIVKTKAYLLAASKIIQLTSGDWESLASLKNVYTKEHLVEPVGAKRWTNDGYFGLQRVSSCSHGLIKLCVEIPDKFGVTDEMLKPLLEGMTISQAIEKKKLFIVDLDILKDLPCAKPELKVCAPIALFLENSEKQLVPLAIQLFQDKGPNNPVFLPTDNPWTWLLAKMWYNNADASYHQSLTHLGLTHLIMEGISVITHRNLSQSHPIFKLLAPHFLYLIAINTRGLEVLISEGGWVDKTMTIGIKGMFELIKRGCERWRMDVDGIIPENLKERGLMEPGVLHYFPYRDDSLLMFEAIKNYVTDMVNLYYPTPDLLTDDWEIQEWGAEMVKSKDQGGVGLNGVPGNGKFTTTDQLIGVLTCIITTCSVGHAAANFPQYDEYAFPPNFPGLLRGQFPTDKNPRTEQDILKAIPDKLTTLDTMVVTKILSGKGTKSLGDFEVNYIFDPEARKIVEKFRNNILEAGKVIKQRNTERNPPYVWLEHEHIPNSISI